MSETAHTPGPWFCDVTDQGGAGCEAYVAVTTTVNGERQQIIAKIVCYDDRLNQLPYKDTARIIIAAPDMQAALRPFAKYFATYSKTMGTKSLRPATGPIFGLNMGADDEAEITVEDFKAIIAALAKAESQS